MFERCYQFTLFPAELEAMSFVMIHVSYRFFLFLTADILMTCPFLIMHKFYLI